MNTSKYSKTEDVIISAIQDKKGSKIQIINLSKIETAPAEEFIVCQARNPIQVAAVADIVIDEMLDKMGRKPVSTDGYRNREWIIIDYGDIIVHVFLPDIRERYALDELYIDAKLEIIPDDEF